jgi:hypothetical protein
LKGGARQGSSPSGTQGNGAAQEPTGRGQAGPPPRIEAVAFPASLTRLCDLQRRQEAAQDALLLRNRIALLKAEEEKAWRKIEQTKKRAAELLKLRADNGRSQAELRELRELAERELQASIQVKRELVLSIDSIQKKKELGLQLTEARRCEAQQLKEEKQKWKEMTDKAKREELLEAVRRKEEIENQKEALRAKKLAQKHEVDKSTKERALERVRAEEEMLRQREQEVQDMERVERELIERLRSTQHLQKQAFEELEAALTGGAGSPSPTCSIGVGRSPAKE